MTIHADDREGAAALEAPSRGRKVERAFGPLGFPCAPAAKPVQLAAPEPAPATVAEPVPVPVVAEPAQQQPRAVTSSTQRIGHGSIAIFAGADALAELRDGRLRPERVHNFVGASSGPKWLVLHGIDRALFPWLLRRAHTPLHVVGSSIGSWRAAALASRDPLDALERLSHEYIEQPHSRHPTANETHRSGEKILSAVLGPEGVRPLLSHPWLRLHIVTARMRLLSIERVVFDRDGDPGPFAPWPGVPTKHVPLTAHNALTALQASAVIPSVMEGFDAEIDAADGFTLFPSIGPKLAPGWLDKMLPSQRTQSLRRTIMIAPSAAHLASLPGGKIPDRSDFATMSDRERITAWRHVITLGHAMGYQLMELLESDRIRHVAQPLG